MVGDDSRPPPHPSSNFGKETHSFPTRPTGSDVEGVVGKGRNDGFQ